MRIQESAENYLEMILILSKTNEKVRSIDIANKLKFSKPSVSVAMKNLKKDGYIDIDEGGFITLSKTGRKIAETMYERHTLLSDWLIELGIDKDTALTDACRMEHTLSTKSFKAIKQYIEENKLK